MASPLLYATLVTARHVIDSVLGLVFPPRCPACDLLLGWPDAPPLCPPCADTLLESTSPVGAYAAAAPYAYGGQLATAIERLKYERAGWVARPLGRLWSSHLLERVHRLGADELLAVPLHRRRRASRGYNQAELLARHAGARVMSPDVMTRVRPTPAQARLGRSARLANMRGAFRIRRADALRGRRVLVLDDVITTGATVAACMRALADAGAIPVGAAALAVALD